jgi:hypothetical protein
MGEHDSGSGSNAGAVILVAFLVVGLVCCGGGAVVGLGVFSFRAAAVPKLQPPVMVQPQPMRSDAKVESIAPEEARPTEPPSLDTLPPAGDAKSESLPPSP